MRKSIWHSRKIHSNLLAETIVAAVVDTIAVLRSCGYDKHMAINSLDKFIYLAYLGPKYWTALQFLPRNSTYLQTFFTTDAFLPRQEKFEIIAQIAVWWPRHQV